MIPLKLNILSEEILKFKLETKGHGFAILNSGNLIIFILFNKTQLLEAGERGFILWNKLLIKGFFFCF